MRSQVAKMLGNVGATQLHARAANVLPELGGLLGHVGFAPQRDDVASRSATPVSVRDVRPCWACVFDSEPEHSCGGPTEGAVPGTHAAF